MTKQNFITEFNNGKLYIEGYFNVNGQLFKALRRLGDFRDYDDALYYYATKQFDDSIYDNEEYDDEEYDDSIYDSEDYYGRFLFEIENIKPMRLNEFLDRTGYSIDKYIDGEKTMAEWFIELATN